MSARERTRRSFTAAEKVAILRRHYVDKVPISDVCDEYRLNPNMFYKWQKRLFENAEVIFQQAPGSRKTESTAQKTIEQLPEKVQQKNEVIAELLEEHVQLKKACGEP